MAQSIMGPDAWLSTTRSGFLRAPMITDRVQQQVAVGVRSPAAPHGLPA